MYWHQRQRPDQSAAFLAALQREHNAPVTPRTDPIAQQHLSKAATDFLRTNDKEAKRQKRKRAWQQARDIRQATNNPQLIAERRKALLRTQ